MQLGGAALSKMEKVTQAVTEAANELGSSHFFSELYCLLDLERAFAMLVCLQHLTKYWRRRKVILL